MKYLDLSHSIETGMPVYPGTPGIEANQECTFESDGFRELALKFSSHTGTHIDAPAHILQSGKFLNQLNLSAFTGSAIVISLCEGEKKLWSWLRSNEELFPTVDFVLFYTGHDKYWGNNEYFRNIPTPSPELVTHFCQFTLKGIGIDAISIDPVGSERLENHHIILKQGMIIIENLTNLDKLLGKTFRFNCFPLPLINGDGSPVRAMAEIED